MKLLKESSGPALDWKIILLTTILLLVLVTAINVLIFIRLDKEEVFVSSPTTGRTIDLSVLRVTTHYYQNKALEFTNITTGRATPLRDPSL